MNLLDMGLTWTPQGLWEALVFMSDDAFALLKEKAPTWDKDTAYKVGDVVNSQSGLSLPYLCIRAYDPKSGKLPAELIWLQLQREEPLGPLLEITIHE